MWCCSEDLQNLSYVRYHGRHISYTDMKSHELDTTKSRCIIYLMKVGNNELEWKQGRGSYRIEPEFEVAVAFA